MLSNMPSGENQGGNNNGMPPGDSNNGSSQPQQPGENAFDNFFSLTGHI